jgi:hypothetical protein
MNPKRRALLCAFVVLLLLYAGYSVRRVGTWSEIRRKPLKNALARDLGTLSLPSVNRRASFTHDLAILILTCNRQLALEALLSTLANADGISSKAVYVSFDCNPGPLLNLTLWSDRGLAIQRIDSHQRHIVEADTAKARRDERVTRHWLHAVNTVLLQHDHVLYLEDDHLVHPSILYDAQVLLLMQPTLCPTCFAVQLGCYRDCWGMASATTTASDVARMEPGNMGVVYHRNTWKWFMQYVEEYCSIYGIWDVNLHHVLSIHTQHQHALTFLKSRVVHNSACGSDRNTVGRARCDDVVLQQDRMRLVTQNMSMYPILSDHGIANMPGMTIQSTRSIRADTDTKNRCIESTRSPSAIVAKRTAYNLQILIPFSRIRVRMLCFLLHSLEAFQHKYQASFNFKVFLVRTGPATHETDLFWNDTTSPQAMFEKCQGVNTNKKTTTQSTFHLLLTVISRLPGQNPFPVALQHAKPTATQHAEPDRMRQTWDYMQILRYAFTRRADTEYTLVLEDDIELCPDFFDTLYRVLQRPNEDLPVFVGGFGASALGYPTVATAGLARFLERRIRDSNLDVLISKGFDAKSKWFAPVGYEGSAEELALDIWMSARSCVYKPSVFLVLHRGGHESNFGVAHTENIEIRCGSVDAGRFFVHAFAEEVREAVCFRSCIS